MVDKLAGKTRSKIMASIRGKNTKPELTIRKLLWEQGKRYRVHDRSVFGIPDISSREAKLAVFIDGCFWHGCPTCYKEPSTNPDFWRNKIFANKERREVVRSSLLKDGWNVLEFWEHDIRTEPAIVACKIMKFL